MSNEMNKIKLPFNKRTLDYYELILTEDCNFRCKYCFDDSFSDRTGCNYNHVISIEMIPDIINFIEKTRNKKYNSAVTFFGGEPTLNWDFIENFIDYCKTKDLRYSFSMNSNASLLTPERVDFLVKNKVELVISLDGIKESHNNSRVFKGNIGTWDSIMKNLPVIISKYVSSNIPVTAMMVVNKDTFKDLEKNYKFLRSLNFAEVNILWCWEEKFSEEDLKFILDSLKKLFIEERYPLWLDCKRGLLSSYYNTQNKSYCHIPQRGITINSRGQIFFCHRLVPKMSDSGFNDKLGTIYEGFTNKEYLKFLSDRTQGKNKEVNATCKKCECYSFCKSGCLGAIRDNTDSYLTLESLCNIQKMLLKFKNEYLTCFPGEYK